MSYSSRKTPRSGKFAHLKNIRGDTNGVTAAPVSAVTLHHAPGAASPGVLAAIQANKAAALEGGAPKEAMVVSSTVEAMDRRKEGHLYREDTDERIRRHRYAQKVIHFMDEASQYHSVGLFVESMLRELQADDSADVAMRAAVGTWALNLLAAQSGNSALDAIAEAVLPAVYCQYTPTATVQPSAAIRAQVRDPAIMEGNPYFTHSMYVEQVNVGSAAVEELTTGLRQAVAANDLRRDHVLRRLEAERTSSVRTAFRAWRAHVRRARALAATNENRSKRQEAAMRRLRVQAAFYQWKTNLELSRNAFLTERLHEAAGQLENAKNQFQLQCYRADRLIQTTKDIREELATVHQLNEDLQRRVQALKDELVQREIEFNAKLASNVSTALQLVQSYGQVVTVLAESRMQPLPHQTENGSEDALAEEEEALYGNLASPGMGPQLLSSEIHPATTSHNGATVGEKPVGMPGDGEEESAEETALSTLRRWCNSVLREVQGAHFRPITNFGRDFANGVAYLVILNYVLPETTSLVPNQESNVEYRLRRIKDMCSKSGLVHVLDPDDFADKREDRILQSLCELYSHHVDRQWKSTATAAAVRLTEELRGDAGTTQAVVTVVDDTTFQTHVSECQERLEAIKATLLEQAYLEEDLVASKERVRAEEAHLAGEERKGVPLLFVGQASTRPFWMIKPGAIEDLRDPEKIGNDVKLWAQLTAGPLPRTLRQLATTTSRLFSFYAGGNVRAMTEFAFWRLVETQNLCSSGPSKEQVAHIFDRVASPQLAAAIKAASYGRNDMDTHTLMHVARQELDIRHISPSQFVEILVRIGVEVNGRALGLVEGIGRFLRDIPLPRTSLLAPVQAAFYEPDSQYIIHFFSDDLARVFFFYLKKQEASKVARDRVIATQDGGRFAGLLSVASYTRMLDDCAFLSDGTAAGEGVGASAGPRTQDWASSTTSSNASPTAPSRARGDSTEVGYRARAFISTPQVQECLNGLIKPYSSLRTGEITFTVFLESLGMVSHYWCPNPLIPGPRKLAAFLADYIGQLNSRHANSTLILGTPPFVPLEGGPKVDLTMKSDMYM